MTPAHFRAARIVPPSTPTSEAGLYWGYSVRLADSLAAVFSESPYVAEGGYDVSIGTSERGTPVEDILSSVEPFRCVSTLPLPTAHRGSRHMLLALGPLSGLEITIAGDPLIPLQAEEASDLFDHWINVVEGQGSRTVRTEVRFLACSVHELTWSRKRCRSRSLDSRRRSRRRAQQGRHESTMQAVIRTRWGGEERVGREGDRSEGGEVQ